MSKTKKATSGPLQSVDGCGLIGRPRRPDGTDGADAADPGERFLAALDPDGPEWRRLSLREPAAPVHPAFLSQVARGLQGVFAPWLRHGSSDDFVAMLLRQHRTIHGDGVYRGESGSDNVRPGRFRSSRDHVFFRLPLAVIADWTNSLDPAAAGVTGWMHRPAIAGIPQACLGSLHAVGDPAVPFPPDDAAGSPAPLSKEPHVMRLFPGAAHRAVYLKRMQTLMAGLRPPGTDAPEGDTGTFLRNLADYYHVGINAHLFMAINNSLLMSHVNYLLKARGLVGIAPGHLDWIAFATDTGEFRGAFLAAVAAGEAAIGQRGQQDDHPIGHRGD